MEEDVFVHIGFSQHWQFNYVNSREGKRPVGKTLVTSQINDGGSSLSPIVFVVSFFF